MASAASAASAALQPIYVTVNNLPNAATWLQYVQVFGTILVAVVAAVIAYRIQKQQVAIAHRSTQIAANKLKLDLFEQRSTIYQAADDLIRDRYFEIDSGRTIKENTRATRAGYQELKKLMVGAAWLFSDELDEHLRKLRAAAWARIKDHFKRVADADQTQEHWDKYYREDDERMNQEATKLAEMVKPFMAIKHEI